MILILKNLNHVYKKKMYEDISFHIKQNSIIQIFGDNGSGKTTLIYVLSGLTSMHDGKLIIKFKTPSYIFNDLQLLLNRTVLENTCISYFCKYGYIPKLQKNRCFELLKIFDLDKLIDQPASILSLGQRQLVSILRVLINDDFDIIFADEPFSNLSEKNRLLASKMLYEHVKKNKSTLILIDHTNVYNFNDIEALTIS